MPGKPKQDPQNYRFHGDRNKELINKSLTKFGAGRSILLDNDEYTIAGNGVLEQAEALGIPVRVIETDGKELIAVKRTDISPDDPKRKELALADNATTDSSDWDTTMLLEHWTGDELGEWDVELPEFDQEAEVGEDDFQEEPPKEPKTVLGDLYELNGHRVHCADSIDSEYVSKLMNAIKADMVFTDPPYNIDYENIKHPKFKSRKIENDNMSSDDFREFCQGFVSNIKLFNKGCSYVAGPPGPDGRIMFSVLDESLHCSTVVIWNKDVFTLGRGKYQNKYEPIWFGWNNSGEGFTTKRNLTNVWDIPRPKKSEDHPTMKPIKLVSTAMEHASRKDDVILDLFLGSGTTVIAAEQLNRKCYGQELDPAYCDVIVRRWVKYMKENGKKYTVKRNGKDITNDDWLTS